MLNLSIMQSDKVFAVESQYRSVVGTGKGKHSVITN